ARSPDHRLDGAGERRPLVALELERAASPRGQRVDPPPASSLVLPAALQQAVAFEPVQRRVDRAFPQVECAPALLAQALDHAVTVSGAGGDGAEQQQIELSAGIGWPAHTSEV